jgi:hypothetical protein
VLDVLSSGKGVRLGLVVEGEGGGLGLHIPFSAGVLS